MEGGDGQGWGNGWMGTVYCCTNNLFKQKPYFNMYDTNLNKNILLTLLFDAEKIPTLLKKKNARKATHISLN